jgi:hypothetical protein
LATIITLCFLSWPVWFGVPGVTTVLIVIAVLISRTRSYRTLADARRRYAREFPSYVLQLSAGSAN